MSGRHLPRPATALPLVGVLLLPLLATQALSSAGWVDTVLRGCALLLALAVSGVADEPEARLLDASPTAFVRRVLARLGVLAVVAVPVCAASWQWSTQSVQVDPLPLTREVAVLCVVALVLSCGLRRWGAVAEPAVLTGPLLVGGLLLVRVVAQQLPVEWSPDAAWSAWLALGIILLALVLRDPATATVTLPGSRRR